MKVVFEGAAVEAPYGDEVRRLGWSRYLVLGGGSSPPYQPGGPLSPNRNPHPMPHLGSLARLFARLVLAGAQLDSLRVLLGFHLVLDLVRG